MSSGFKQVVIQTQERAVSPDINRAQVFAAHGVMEVMRYLTACSTTDDVDAGGNVVEATSGATPLYGKILNGLECRPQTGAGQLSVQVTPGAAMVLVNDLDADASQFKLVVDPGIPSNGLLLMSPNAAGSPRIDVVEVQWSSVVTSTDNRDIFNAATGLFVATNVTKSTQGNLTSISAPNIRLRLGTPGAGYPGNAAGWMPLMVVFNPAGSTQCDDMDFWDVRPLAHDAVHVLGDASQDLPLQSRFVGSANDLDVGGKTTITGVCESTIGSRRVGGRMLSGCPGADASAALDAQLARDQESGFAPTATGLWYLYLCTPFGLPRWARYTRTGPRKPRSPRGIPVVSMTGPANTSGVPLAAIAMPASTGLGGTTTSAVCVMSSQLLASAPRGGIADGKRFLLAKMFASFGHFGYGAASNDNNKCTFNLQDNVTHPANARAIIISIRLIVTFTTGSLATTFADNGATANGPTGGIMLGTPSTAPTITNFVGVFNPGAIALSNGNGALTVTTGALEIPLFPGYPAGAAITRQLEWIHNFATNCVGGTCIVSGTPDMQVLGWVIGD